MDISEIKAIFNQSILDYHVKDSVDNPIVNRYAINSLQWYSYLKNWIDTVQWHLEDIIRNPEIEPLYALLLKRRIDSSNQERTDIVENLDEIIMSQIISHTSTEKSNNRINTESIGWALDRLSILQLKIYHMKEEVSRTDVSAEHIARCKVKLQVLEKQDLDLTQAISHLIEDVKNGNRKVYSYKQMKMYNDPSLNPVLYGRSK